MPPCRKHLPFQLHPSLLNNPVTARLPVAVVEPQGVARAAEREGTPPSAVNRLAPPIDRFLEGHPMHGINLGNWENMLPLVDAWVDGREPPPPYRWPPR